MKEGWGRRVGGSEEAVEENVKCALRLDSREPTALSVEKERMDVLLYVLCLIGCGNI